MMNTCRRCGAFLDGSVPSANSPDELCSECAMKSAPRRGFRATDDQIMRWLDSADDEESEAAIESA